MQTYADFQGLSSSEKVGLAIVEAAQRLTGWTASGTGYFVDFEDQVVTSVTEDGVELNEASSDVLAAGEYYLDREAGRLYVRTSLSANPDSLFLAATSQLFFSTIGVAAPHDLASGFDVYWEPMLKSSSVFSTQVENTKTLLGVALATTSGIKFLNDQDYWSTRFDRYIFESHRVAIYSWNRALPITEAKVLFKGTTVKRSYSAQEIGFELKDLLDGLRAPVSLPYIQDYVSAIVTDGLATARQRTLYGYLYGHVPTPIDQVLSDGREITGTVSVVNGSPTVTGSGTSFLSELSPGDDLLIGSNTEKVRIETVDSNTSLTLADDYLGDTESAVAANVIPSHPKRYVNREFLVAGHELSRPALTVTAVIDNSQFFLDTTDLLDGDALEFSGDIGIIRVLGDGFVKLESAFQGALTAGSTVYRASVSNVYLNEDLLSLTRDYSYDATTAKITLTDTAEFNIAIPRDITGDITITDGSRLVTGVGTIFRTELDVGDWIKITANSTYFEILDIEDDENLTVRTVPGASDAGTSQPGKRKNVSVYRQGSSVLSCDAIGKKDADGNFIKTPSQIAKDILIQAGLEDDILESTFDTGEELAPHRMGISIPDKMNSKNAPNLRDTLNKVCRSAFCSIVQNEDFQLEFSVIEPSYSSLPSELEQSDMIEFSIDSDASNIVAAVNVNWLQREYDPFSKAPSNSVERYENNQYLSQVEREFTIDTYLVDADDALIFASRWAFLLERASSDITFKSGMQVARFQVNDTLVLNHPKFYQRFGSMDNRRIGAIVAIAKTVSGATVTVSDLGNAFSRVARIAEDTQSDYDEAELSEQLISGFQTDANGLTEGNPGINVIW